MPAHNSHIRTRTHAPRAGTHTRGTPSLPSLSHNQWQLLGSSPSQALRSRSPRRSCGPAPLARSSHPRGRGAGVGHFLPPRPSHTAKRCLPPPSTRPRRGINAPPPPSSGPPSPDPAWGLPLQQMNRVFHPRLATRLYF